jgi:hypothetical protein
MWGDVYDGLYDQEINQQLPGSITDDGSPFARGCLDQILGRDVCPFEKGQNKTEWLHGYTVSEVLG